MSWEWVVVKWMNLDPITQSDVSQKEKKKIVINAHIWNLEKKCWRAHLQGRNVDTDLVNRLVDTVVEGEGRMNWESSTEMWNHYTTMCKIDSWWEFVIWHRELKLVLCENLEKSDGMGMGREAWREGIYIYSYDLFELLYGRNQHKKAIIL